MTPTIRAALAAAVTALATAAPVQAQRVDVHDSTLGISGSEAFTGEVWVDNWFALWIDGRKALEDSVPITTERSFNAERFAFRADRPVTFAFEFRDFMENPTGLEYIGTGRQQMGDGGAIAQIRDAAGRAVLVSDASWRCLVVQHAPVDTSCARERSPRAGSGACAARVTASPKGWTAPGFDDSRWPVAVTHSASAVGPKDGYDRISWDRAARLIWGPDLQRDNIVLCRATLN